MSTTRTHFFLRAFLWGLVLALVAVILLPASAKAADMIVSGFAGSGVDGTYAEGSAINSRPSYYNGTYYLCWTADSSFWTFRSVNTCTSGSGSVPYYSSDNVGTPDLAGTWIDNGGGTPVGTVSAGGSGTSTATTTTVVVLMSTSTEAMAYGSQYLMFGILWFLVFFATLYVFKRLTD